LIVTGVLKADAQIAAQQSSLLRARTAAVDRLLVLPVPIVASETRRSRRPT